MIFTAEHAENAEIFRPSLRSLRSQRLIFSPTRKWEIIQNCVTLKETAQKSKW